MKSSAYSRFLQTSLPSIWWTTPIFKSKNLDPPFNVFSKMLTPYKKGGGGGGGGGGDGGGGGGGVTL